MRFRRHSTFALAVILAAIAGAHAGAQEGRGAPVIGGPATGDCESCRSAQRPPWHGSVVAGRGMPAAYGHAGVASPCQSGHCGPAPACRACGLPGVCGATGACHPPMPCGWWGYPYPLPPCLPRLSSCLREGILLSPQPLAVPRCHRCGAHIEGGF